MKKRLLSLISAMALCFTAMPSYAVAEDTNDDIYEYELMLSCSETHFYDDDDTLTYFYVDTDYEGETITLVDADSLTEYTMVDDGKFSISGDDLQNDGVYTTKIELDTTMTSFSKEYHFYAVTGDGSNSSNTVTIKITKKITDAQIKEMGAVDEAVSTLKSTKNYKSASNNEKITMLYELLSELAENGTEQYPYSLIQKDSIKLSDDKKTYSFNYYFGLASSTMIAVSVNEDNMTVSVVDYDTGELILTDTDQVWAITLQAGFSVEYALTDGTFAWGTDWVDLGAWSYGSLNPCKIDISSYETGLGVEGFQVVDMYIPYGYFLPEDYLEMNYKESDTEHTDFPSDITVKLKKTTMGDVNDDGAFNVSDVVLLQKWLLAVPDTHLANWKAADFCEDNKLDVFDLCLMKRELINQPQEQELYLATLTASYSGHGVDGSDLGSGEYTENFTVKKGDVFYETMDGHWIRENEPGTSEILRINDIDSTSVSLTYSHWGEMTDIWIPFGGNLDVDSVFQVMDGINYSYNISFSDNNDVAAEKYITVLDYTTVGQSDAITSTEELEDYLNQFERRNDNTIGQNFDNIIEKYDEEFFRSNVLLLKPILGTSTASHFSINKVFYKGNKLIIDYVDNVDEEGCDIIIGYLGVVAIPKADFHAESVEWRLTSYDYVGIKSGYIAVFIGEDTSHNIIHETYIYKIDNGAGNYGFDYINTYFNTKTGGKYKLGQGSVMWTDDVFPVAKANNAYDYVTVPGDDTKYTIEEFMERFLMD